MDDPAPAAAPAPAPHAMDTDEAATASSVRAEGWHTRASIAQDCPRVPRVCLPAGTPSMVWWSDCWPTPLPQHRVNRPGSSHEVSADVSCLNVFFSVGLFAYREAHLMYVPLCLARDAGGVFFMTRTLRWLALVRLTAIVLVLPAIDPRARVMVPSRIHWARILFIFASLWRLHPDATR
eukprot:CAMPEP_0202866062 /NCGR_PEP_ID=MMETSP1391-20130828/7181_1 /ASSEMBLY_ACC=CAM_ASM_000867 /TAXON_ID=1034604 /ORGANISM="Chlamydomonas leiostraca, Strain SAG 11-49" /LENGTH=178 /DNA_ID=CAMNT_0049545975 /DNA_START=339 /DNA_END=873 /DNA_ORIENTATION=+